MKKIVYYNIPSFYGMNSQGRVFDMRSMKEIFYNPDSFKIKLNSTNPNKKYSYPDITSLYAITILGSRSRKNKRIAYEFYNRQK